MYFIAIACVANIVLDYVFMGVFHIGPAGAALGTIISQTISFVFLVPSSMLSTVSALCAQNIGAGKHDRAEKTLQYAIMITVGFGIAVSVLVQFFAEPVVGLFTTDQLVQIPVVKVGNLM